MFLSFLNLWLLTKISLFFFFVFSFTKIIHITTESSICNRTHIQHSYTSIFYELLWMFKQTYNFFFPGWNYLFNVCSLHSRQLHVTCCCNFFNSLVHYLKVKTHYISSHSTYIIPKHQNKRKSTKIQKHKNKKNWESGKWRTWRDEKLYSNNNNNNNIYKKN